MSQRTAPFTVHLALFAGALIYAIFFSIAKGIMPHYLRAEGFIVLRIGSACLLYWLTHFLLIREKVQRKHLVKLAV